MAETMDLAELDFAQFHGEQDLAAAKALGPERVIRVFWPERYALEPEKLSLDLAKWADFSAFFLFDAGDKGGGHGRKLNRLSVLSPKPYLWAGGLAEEDLWRLWPASDPNFLGFDFNSKVETAPGIKDQLAIEALFSARAALALKGPEL
jgi:phosphoribosylanthranilate isomerase